MLQKIFQQLLIYKVFFNIFSFEKNLSKNLKMLFRGDYEHKKRMGKYKLSN